MSGPVLGYTPSGKPIFPIAGGAPTTAELRTRGEALTAKLLEEGDKLRQLREKPKEQRSDSWLGEMRETIQGIQAMDAELNAVERSYRAAQAALWSVDPSEPMAATLARAQAEMRSPGELFIASDQYKERRGQKVDEAQVRSFLIAPEQRTLITSSTSDTPAAGVWLPKASTPIPPRVQQLRPFVRDLINVQETGLASIPYLQEVNAVALEGGASAVAEASAKPEATIQWTSQDAPARKIAVWVPITEEEVGDAPIVRGYIDNRLVYMLKFREQDQILNGSGTAPNLKGIRQWAGLQTQAAVAGESFSSIGRGIGKIELVDAEADGIAMHPTDFWTAVTTRFANQYDNGFGTGSPFNGPPQGVWGLPVVRSRAMPLGKALVGAWQLGATLFDRLQATIRTTDSHQDYFIFNKLVILAEERVALAVHRPDFFCEVTL